MKISIIGLILVLAACASLVPATTPPQLQSTPGAPILLDDDRIVAAPFELRYPEGWRVVKSSVTGAPLTVTLVSPDDAQVIIVSEAPIAVPDGLPDDTRIRRVALPPTASRAAPVYLLGYASSSSAAAAFDEHVALVERSLRASR